jgi:DNA-binding MarR family transcriptional regulator
VTELTDLVRVETRLYNLVDARLRIEHDMTLGMLQFLRIMNRGSSCRVYDIAHEVDITVGATSKAVDRIEARGWCRRQANPDDRRSSLLVLTSAGQRALAAATPTFEAALAEHVASLPPPVLDQLAEGLGQWRRDLEQRAAAATRGPGTGH